MRHEKTGVDENAVVQDLEHLIHYLVRLRIVVSELGWAATPAMHTWHDHIYGYRVVFSLRFLVPSADSVDVGEAAEVALRYEADALPPVLDVAQKLISDATAAGGDWYKGIAPPKGDEVLVHA